MEKQEWAKSNLSKVYRIIFLIISRTLLYLKLREDTIVYSIRNIALMAPKIQLI